MRKHQRLNDRKRAWRRHAREVRRVKMIRAILNGAADVGYPVQTRLRYRTANNVLGLIFGLRQRERLAPELKSDRWWDAR